MRISLPNPSPPIRRTSRPSSSRTVSPPHLRGGQRPRPSRKLPLRPPLCRRLGALPPKLPLLSRPHLSRRLQLSRPRSQPSFRGHRSQGSKRNPHLPLLPLPHPLPRLQSLLLNPKRPLCERNRRPNRHLSGTMSLQSNRLTLGKPLSNLRSRSPSPSSNRLPSRHRRSLLPNLSLSLSLSRRSSRLLPRSRSRRSPPSPLRLPPSPSLPLHQNSPLVPLQFLIAAALGTRSPISLSSCPARLLLALKRSECNSEA